MHSFRDVIAPPASPAPICRGVVPEAIFICNENILISGRLLRGVYVEPAEALAVT